MYVCGTLRFARRLCPRRRGILEDQLGCEQSEKLVHSLLVAPAQMLLAAAADADTPSVSGKPGEFQGWATEYSAPRCLGKTTDFKDETVGIKKNVLVAPLLADAVGWSGYWVPTLAAEHALVSAVCVSVVCGVWEFSGVLPLALRAVEGEGPWGGEKGSRGAQVRARSHGFAPWCVYRCGGLCAVRVWHGPGRSFVCSGS